MFFLRLVKLTLASYMAAVVGFIPYDQPMTKSQAVTAALPHILQVGLKLSLLVYKDDQTPLKVKKVATLLVNVHIHTQSPNRSLLMLSTSHFNLILCLLIMIHLPQLKYTINVR